MRMPLQLPVSMEFVKDHESSLFADAFPTIFQHDKELCQGIVQRFLLYFRVVVDHGKACQLSIHHNEVGPAFFLRPVAVQPVIAVKPQGIDVTEVILGKLIVVLFQQIPQDLFFIHGDLTKFDVHEVSSFQHYFYSTTIPPPLTRSAQTRYTI